MTVTWLNIDKEEQSTLQAKEGTSEKPVAESGKRRTRSEAKRKQILDVARREFLKNGFGGTSIDSIVDIVGGSKSTIYSHFTNKETLFAAVIRDFGHGSELPDFPVTDGDVYNELYAFAEDRMKRVLSPLNINIMRIVIAEAGRQSKIAELYYRNAPEPTYRALRNYLKQAVERRELTVDNLDEATEEFLGGLLQHSLLARLFGMENDISEEECCIKAKQLTDSFLANYGNAPS